MAIGLLGGAVAPAVAAPASVTSDVARIVGEEPAADGAIRLEVDSPAMKRKVPVMVLPAGADSPRGTLYLLDGNSGQTEGNNWLNPEKGDAAPFLADKDVNVVFPVGGTGTLYADWREPHPEFSTVKWETFLIEELPPLIDARFDTNGKASIGGISTGAQGALMLAARNPGTYRAVAGYSGCYTTDGMLGRIVTELEVSHGGAAGAEKMWGPSGGPEWEEHDIFRNAAGLKNTHVYLSSGSGLPGPYETLDAPNLLDRVFVGGSLEFGANQCANQLEQALRGHGVEVTRSVQPVGVHHWPYWRDELVRSWSLLEASVN